MSVKTSIGMGAVIGITAGVSFTLVLLMAIAIIGNDIEERQADALVGIRRAAEQEAAATICGLGAPTTQEEQPDGTVQTRRPETFLNRVCLVALGFDAVDLDGDGQIEIGGTSSP